MKGQESINRVKGDSRYVLESMTRPTHSLTPVRQNATPRAHLQSANKENDHHITIILVSFCVPSVAMQR